MYGFISQFYPLLDSIKHECKKTSYGKIEIIEIKSPAKKFSELRTLDNILIEIASHFYRLFNYSEDKFGIGRYICNSRRIFFLSRR